MAFSTLSNAAGSVEEAWLSAPLIALTQAPVPQRTQVSIMLAKPTSLPPMVIDTSVAELVTEEIWLLRTSLVFAPEQAAKVKADGLSALSHSWAYALALRLQEPLLP